MSIVFSAITPHPPILIPNIGKENISHLSATVSAFAKLKERLAASNPDTIFLISPHGTIKPETFSLNLSPEFSADFEDFGDFSTKKTWAGEVGLAHRIRESLETVAPLHLMHEGELDHGTSVPLFLLTDALPGIKVLPLYYSGLDNAAHFKIGQMIHPELQKSKTRIAIIASGDLSHRLTEDAPGGFSPKGKKFDNKLIELLQKKDPEKIINLDQSLIFEAGECGLKSILVLLGIMSRINYSPKLYSYEAPFGVGYMVMNFEL